MMVLKISLKIYEKIYQGEKEVRRGDPLESGRSELQSLFLRVRLPLDMEKNLTKQCGEKARTSAVVCTVLWV